MTTQELRDQIYGVLESRDVMGGDSKVVLVDRIEELIIDRSRQAQLAILDQVRMEEIPHYGRLETTSDEIKQRIHSEWLTQNEMVDRFNQRIDTLQATLKGEQSHE